ncbi:MAG: helix-turn-helix transcriptional regulator [Ignavibacteriales bacterium]|nr:helix-turn-helix transcriptional regulator [Ignavibacteriales bacterium]MBK7979750.1 helix-turn-helix transcriptional regulator [Ignavibacteriota bacterium]
MTPQEEIRYLIQSHGIKQNWLAKKLGLKPQTLSYLVNESSKIDNHLYKMIKDIIENNEDEIEIFNGFGETNFDLFADEKLRMGIGGRIRLFAKKRYGTLKKLAEVMEISPQQLHQYISGKREPGSKILLKLLKHGCDVNWLLSGSESMESFKIDKLERELSKLQESITQISAIVKTKY